VFLALASVAIEAGLVSGVKLPSALYLWTAPVWLVWFLLAQWTATAAGEEVQAE